MTGLTKPVPDQIKPVTKDGTGLADFKTPAGGKV